jgi:hypothetical protein
MTTAAPPSPAAPPPPPPPSPAPGREPRRAGAADPPASRPPSPSPAGLWRRWRVPVALVALVLLGGIVIALLQPAPVITGYLDPAGTDTTGAHAITDLLSNRGDTVIRAITPSAAEAAAGQGGPGPVTLVITSPGLLTARQLADLARVPANRVLIGPDRAALSALAPGVGLAGTAPVQALAPGCDLTAARLAGSADLGGARLTVRQAPPPRLRRGRRARRSRTRTTGTTGTGRTTSTTGPGGAALCYPTGGSPSLVRYTAAGRVITVLGSGNALTNGSLAQVGNAALALNLFGTRSRIVWLVPGPGLLSSPSGGAPENGQRSLLSLIPLPAYLVTLQLGIAVVLAALWRARRLGPLVPEPLPVVVRASETVEGHAGLYRSRHARGRAAAALRTAMLARTLPALGLAPQAQPGEVVAAFSARSGSAPARIEAMLFGPVPGDDAALVALADDLDTLEKEVRTH